MSTQVEESPRLVQREQGRWLLQPALDFLQLTQALLTCFLFVPTFGISSNRSVGVCTSVSAIRKKKKKLNPRKKGKIDVTQYSVIISFFVSQIKPTNSLHESFFILQNYLLTIIIIQFFYIIFL